ncbi:MAG: DUF885 domain-containing protein, partial [Bacteroidota bacterium]
TYARSLLMGSTQIFSLSMILFLPPLHAQGAPNQANLAERSAEIIVNKQHLNNSERLHKLFEVTWDYIMFEYPEYATFVGYPGQNHRWTDLSVEAIERRKRELEEPLKTLHSIDRSQLSEVDQLNYDLFKKDLEFHVEEARFYDDYMPINQLQGVQQSVASVLNAMPAQTVRQYKDIIARLNGVPLLIEQTIELMEKGLEIGVSPPKITLRDVPAQVENQIVDDPLTRPLIQAFTDYPPTVPLEEQERLREEAVNVYTDKIVRAFRVLHAYLVDTYIPQTRESIAISDLPNGEEWYNFKVRRRTTTNLTPAEIREIGLAEVERIHREMERVIAETGFEGSFAEFSEFLRADPQFYFDDAESLLSTYRDIAKRADPELTKLFGKLPRLPYGVIPVPSYAEKSQTTAYYQLGSLKAGRPGYFFANTYGLKTRPKWEMEALTLHEAVPGHHLQISLAQELEEVPEFRKYGWYTAFVEGWGLYAESLGEEMGFYQDPYSKFGQLTYEMWRAIRLVVDTGIHAFGWSRQQAMDYFKKNSSKSEHDIIVEVDRYIVWPGQALAYKIGELKIKELREYAGNELGDQFDVREFHDVILENGAVPLDVLEAHINAWVANKREK